MRFAKIKTEEQLDLQASIASGPSGTASHRAVLEDAEQRPTPRLRWLLDRMWQEWQQVVIEIKALGRKWACGNSVHTSSKLTFGELRVWPAPNDKPRLRPAADKISVTHFDLNRR